MSRCARVGRSRPRPAVACPGLRRSTRIVTALVLTGCATDAEFLAENASAALQTAEVRGKFELACPDVQTAILSRKVTQSIHGYGWRGAGIHAGPWTEYTIGVRGCGRQAVYMTVCRDPNNCNAFSQSGQIQAAPEAR